MRFLPFLLMAMLAGCADSAGPTVHAGKSYDQLVAERGAPSKSYDLAGGARLVEYKTPGCTARFWIVSQHVQQVTYDGDDSACKQTRENGRARTAHTK
jgi:hypothetical protein